MFVCIVMDYYESGDLGQLLREKRNACEKVEEEVCIAIRTSFILQPQKIIQPFNPKIIIYLIVI